MDSTRPPGPPDPSGASGGPSYGFSSQGADRVIAATKWVEKQVRLPPIGPRGRYPIRGDGGGLSFARTNATLSGRTGDTPGSAAVTLRVWSDSTSSFSDGQVVTAYNPWSVTIASGKIIAVIRGAGGKWFMVSADC